MDNIYQHFRKDEAGFIDKMSESIATAASEFRPVLTDFLDPRQVYITQVLAGSQADITVHQFGGYAAAERCRVILAPSYFEPQPSDYELALLDLNYPQKFAQMHHSTILGTLVNAGVARDVFGDIITDGAAWQVLTSQTMKDFVISSITKVGKISVRFEEVPLANVVVPVNDWEHLQISVSSMRLDSIVSHVFPLSRQRAKSLIEAEKVRLNFEVESAPDVEVGAHDLVSVRHFGRLRVQSLLGTSKKGKLRLAVDVIHK